MIRTKNAVYKDIPLAIGTRIDQWCIKQLIGRTRSGFMYLCNNLKTNRIDFLYEFFPNWNIRRQRRVVPQLRIKDKTRFHQGLESFLRQAHAWSQLHDLHIQPVIHYGEHHGTAIMVTECSSGQSLKELLTTNPGPVDEQQLRWLLQGGLRALYASSQVKLKHTDLSPQTLFLPEQASPCLLAFGVPGISTGCTPLTCYQPIEVEQELEPTGPQTDLYGLGACLYHALTGQPPLEARLRLEAITRGQEDPLIPAVEIGHGRYNHSLTGAIDWMMSPLLRDRPEHPETLLGQITRPQPVYHLIESTPNSAATAVAAVSTNQETTPKPTTVADKAPVTAHTELSDKTETLHRKRRKITLFRVSLASAAGLSLIIITYLLSQLDAPTNRDHNPTTPEFASTNSKANTPTAQNDPPNLPTGLPVRANDQQRITAYRKTNIEDQIRKEIEQQMRSEALDAEQVRQQTLAKDEQQRQLRMDQLWKELVQARKNAHYIWPYQGSVKQLIQKIQGLQANQARVRALQLNLSRWLLSLAEFYRQADEPHQAYLALLQASAFDADERLLQSALLRQQATLNKPDPPPVDPEVAAREVRVKQLLANARRAFSLGNWFSPPGGNALSMFRAALQLDSGNIAAKDGLLRLDQQLKLRLHLAIQKNTKPKAMKWLTGLQTLDPDDPELLILAKRVDQLKSIPNKVAQTTKTETMTANTANPAALGNVTKPRTSKPGKTQARTVKTSQLVEKTDSMVTNAASRANTSTVSPQLKPAIAAYQDMQYTKAYELLQPLVKKRVPRALFRSGMILMGGKGIEPDRPAAFAQLEIALPSITQLSLSGESWAQVALGLYFDKGWLMQSNAETAVALYRKAASTGNADAMNNLGLMYASGRGVTKNLTTATSWLQRARQQGHKIAALNLGKLEQLILNRSKRKQQRQDGFTGN